LYDENKKSKTEFGNPSIFAWRFD